MGKSYKANERSTFVGQMALKYLLLGIMVLLTQDRSFVANEHS